MCWGEAGVMLRCCDTGTNCQSAICAGPLPVIRVILHYIVGFHAVVKHWHKQLKQQERQIFLMDFPIQPKKSMKTSNYVLDSGLDVHTILPTPHHPLSMVKEKREGKTNNKTTALYGKNNSTYLVVRFSEVVEVGNMFQKNTKLCRQVFEHQTMVISLLQLPHMLLEINNKHIYHLSSLTAALARLFSFQGGQQLLVVLTLSLIFLQGNWPTRNSTSM